MEKTAPVSNKPYGTIAPLLRFRRFNLRSALALRNRTFNRQFAMSGAIHGQGLPPVKDMRYGVTNMAHAGCGIIAIYNALLLLGNFQPLSDIAAWGDLYASTALGLLGTSPPKTKRLFRQLGYQVTAARDAALLDGLAANADVCLFTYWNRRGHPLQGMHTVCVRRQADGLEVCNPFDFSARAARYASFKKWIETGISPVVLYGIHQ